MPTDINVADGKLADWHRFDIKDKAVVKDRSVLMSVADSITNAREQLEAIWTKLGRTGAPPNYFFFTRSDVSLNAMQSLPGTPTTAPTLSSKTSTRITINVDIENTVKGGSFPEFVRVRAVSSPGGVTTTLDSPITYPFQTTAPTVNTLTPSTSYDVSYALRNNAGVGPYSTTVFVTTNP